MHIEIDLQLVEIDFHQFNVGDLFTLKQGIIPEFINRVAIKTSCDSLLVLGENTTIEEIKYNAGISGLVIPKGTILTITI